VHNRPEGDFRESSRGQGRQMTPRNHAGCHTGYVKTGAVLFVGGCGRQAVEFVNRHL
jgi:hypothetical protein